MPESSTSPTGRRASPPMYCYRIASLPSVPKRSSRPTVRGCEVLTLAVASSCLVCGTSTSTSGSGRWRPGDSLLAKPRVARRCSRKLPPMSNEAKAATSRFCRDSGSVPRYGAQIPTPVSLTPSPVIVPLSSSPPTYIPRGAIPLLCANSVSRETDFCANRPVSTSKPSSHRSTLTCWMVGWEAAAPRRRAWESPASAIWSSALTSRRGYSAKLMAGARYESR